GMIDHEIESLWAEDDDDSSLVLFLTGAGLGFVIGAGIAVALAPERGIETRAKLQEVACEVADRAGELLTSLQEIGESLAERMGEGHQEGASESN
ncbi:MAG: YtxH domain-containing protein, partial [Proteobacteria bacterium]|nr:YtxH domain-containing protein [Pseudomonadota bacterium]